MSGSMSRNKGARWERKCRKYFHKHIIRYTHVGTDEPDMQLMAGHVKFVLEVKDQKRMDLAGWWRQANDILDLNIPVLVHKRRGFPDVKDAWVTMTGKEFEYILHELNQSPPYSAYDADLVQ